MNGSRMQILRLVIAVGILGCSVYSYVDAACKADCRTAFVLINPANLCRVYEDKATLMKTFNAFNIVKTYNQVNNKKQPANVTGVTLKAWSPPCDWTCAVDELPQEATGVFMRMNYQGESDQRKCTGGS